MNTITSKDRIREWGDHGIEHHESRADAIAAEGCGCGHHGCGGEGYRVIVTYVCGYGTTRFLSSATFRNGQPSAVAVDVIDFMDALKFEKAALAGSTDTFVQ